MPRRKMYSHKIRKNVAMLILQVTAASVLAIDQQKLGPAPD